MGLLNKVFNKIEEKIGFEKKKIIAFLFSILVVSFFNFDLKYLHGSFSLLVYLVGALLISIIIAYVMLKAGFTVIRALCVVGAEISLIIFLGQSYCNVVKEVSPNDKALVAFLSISGVYIIYEFSKHLYSALANRLASIPTKLFSWEKGFVIFFFCLFTIGFLSLTYKVIYPIVSDLCVYKR